MAEWGARRALFLGLLIACLAVARPALAQGYRVATVDAGDPLVRALEATLSPWGVVLQRVHVGQSATSGALPIELARVVAQDAHSNAVVWISADEGRYTLHVYDSDTDQVSERELRSGAPTGEGGARAAARTIKQMLHFSALGPATDSGADEAPSADESSAAPSEMPTWAFGLTASAATHFETNGPQVEARTGLYGSYWPDFLDHRLGVTLGASIGSGVPLLEPTFPLYVNGTLTDIALRAALTAQLPLATWAILQPSLGAGDHLLRFDVSFPQTAQAPSLSHHASPAFDAQLALNLALPGNFARIGPWVGATYLTLEHEIFVNEQQIAVDSRITVEGGVCMEVVLR